MTNSIVRIEKLENGFGVEICDPKIITFSLKPESIWQNPWKLYAFKKTKEVKNFLGRHLDMLTKGIQVPRMNNSILRIEKLENGFEVEICDPEIMASNEMPKSIWQDPWKSYAFKTSKEVKTFVGEHLDSLKPPPDPDAEYHTEFKRQTGEYK